MITLVYLLAVFWSLGAAIYAFVQGNQAAAWLLMLLFWALLANLRARRALDRIAELKDRLDYLESRPHRL